MPTDDRLSRMDTLWSLVREAHKDPRGTGARFLGQLLERYRRPAQQYLLGALRDEAAAEELLQDFSLRFLRGDFWRADPANGRFRNFVKKALCNLVANHRKQQRAQARRQVSGIPADVGSDDGNPAQLAEVALDQALLDQWRGYLLEHAKEQLRQVEAKSKVPYFAALQMRVRERRPTYAEIAAELNAAQPEKPYNEAGIRKIVERAREKFANALLTEVSRSLPLPTKSDIEDEVAQLRLLPYVQTHLQQWLADRLYLR